MKFGLFICMCVFYSPAFTQILTESQVQGIFGKFKGSWSIDSKVVISKDSLLKFPGRAQFDSAFGGKYIRESFEVEINGRKIFGQAFITYSKSHKRFELLQVDNNSTSSIVLTGTWDSSQNVLFLRPIPEHSQWNSNGTLLMHWDYHFLADGTFKKLVHMPDRNGVYEKVQEYRYARLKN